MAILIEIPSALQKITGSEESITVAGATVGEALNALCVQHSALRSQLYDESGKVRSFINVYLNDEDIRYAQQLDTPATDGDVIQLVPSIAGGC